MKSSAMNRRDIDNICRIRQYMNIKEKSELEDDKHYEGKEIQQRVGRVSMGCDCNLI